MKKKTTLLFLALSASQMSHAQLPVTDMANIGMKILDYVEYLNTASKTDETAGETAAIRRQDKDYYDDLKKVNRLVKTSRNVNECLRLSTETLVKFQKTCSKVADFNHHTPMQIEVFRKQQEHVIALIRGNLDRLRQIITKTGMSISDKDRLDAIDAHYAQILRLHGESMRINTEMLGDAELALRRKEQKRLERELLR